MEDFGAQIDMDWEFDAPHWYDFDKEETENPDVWFDEQEAKMERELANDHVNKFKLPNQMYDKQDSTRAVRKPTRIPVPSRTTLLFRAPFT